jgi:hypothetical protein
MANLTITVDAAILKKARLRALTQGSSVNAVLRKFLESYAGVRTEEASALEDLLALSDKARSSHGGGKRWTRDDLHERG